MNDLTILDYFAAKAMQGMLSAKTNLSDMEVAELAYEMALAMVKIKERLEE